METYKDMPVLAFETPADWRAWLDAHHQDSSGVCLRHFKKGSGKPTVTYAQALDEALCYGWIDSTKYAYDDESFLQRFSPRKPRSVWSQVNRDHVARLTAAGLMRPKGLEMVEVAKANGQWEAAYAPQSKATVPEDFQAVLDAHPDAAEFFAGLSQVNRYALLYRIQGVKKPETRLKRIAWALDLLQNKKTVY